MIGRRERGFTLVEAVVVVVIIAVLAVVGVPVYVNYVNNTRQAAVEDLAQTGAASANAYFRKTGSHPDSAALELFLSDPERFAVTVDADERTVSVTDIVHDRSATAHY
jgi:prepilin-type N-terminal cleavage/methylation domain-containing protein